jgi:tripeptide aminopeptidase
MGLKMGLYALEDSAISDNILSLRNVLRIPSFSTREELMVEYIENYCIENKLSYKKDSKNNIYVVKGKVSQDEYFPCAVAHTDTVHRDQIDLVESCMNLDIFEEKQDGKTILTATNPIKNTKTGIGGDDKCGVYICLRLLEKMDNLKCAFFVEEEIGMKGSKLCDLEFFNDVGYAIQFDAPTNDWFSESCSGHRLWSEEYFETIQGVLAKHGVKNISTDPFTDVVQLRKKFDFCCSVLPTGYYNQHSKFEYVVEEETEDCVRLAVDFIEKLGYKKYYFEKGGSAQSMF